MPPDQLTPKNTPADFAQSPQLLNMIDFAPIGLMLIDVDTFSIIHANKRVAELFQADNLILTGRPVLELLPELGEHGRQELLQHAFSSGSAITFNELFLSSHTSNLNSVLYAEIRFQPVPSADTAARTVVMSLYDQTAQVRNSITNDNLAGRAKSILERAPIGAGVYVGSELKIELANATLLGYWGKGSAVIGKTLEEVMPELISQTFMEKLRSVITTGRPYLEKSARAEVLFEGKIRVRYFDISYTPVYNGSGAIYGVLDMALDVTDSVHALDKVVESEQFSRTVFNNSPVAKLVYVGDNMILREANEKMLEIFGRDRSIIGKPLFEAIPELKNSERQKRYAHVLRTGEMLTEAAEKIELIKNGKPYTGYYDYTYKALHNAGGKIYGVMCTAIEVTDKILTLQELHAQESLSRDAVELAELGTWSIDAETLGLTYSDRLIRWFGFDPGAKTYQNVIPVIIAQDRDRIATAVARAMDPASDGIYDETYTIIQPESNRKLILHARGRAIKDEAGKVIRMIGTAQDITAQREVQLALENEVQVRTEELAATIEELSVLNEEMVKTNTDLVRSNEELGQYAYVASHDLQEPLRKIMVYASIISDEPDLPENMQHIVRKISKSAGRMKQLISDLLTFSRLLQEDRTIEMVDLNLVFAAVLDDFELTISEKNAVIDVQQLPSVQGVRLQMNQLFYNLLSNALKFVKPGVQPHIAISCSLIPFNTVIEYIPRPLPFSSYYDIVIKDNGVGFKSQFNDRIFEVFRRLHTNDEFPGSGIGLSVCRRITSNHQGHLFAQSVEGQGTEFHIILPSKQTNS